MLLFPVSTAVATTWFGGGGLWLPAAELILISFVPLAFLAAASRGGFERTSEIAELGAWLGADEVDRPELQAALVDGARRPVAAAALPAPGRGRAGR